MKTSLMLTREQREKCREKFGSVFARFGCRFLLLEGGVDIELLAVGGPAESSAAEPSAFVAGAIHEVEAHTAAPALLGSTAVDPLESAIRETVGLLNEHAVFLAESGLNDVQKAGVRFLGEKLNSHLNHLLGIQLRAVQPG